MNGDIFWTIFIVVLATVFGIASAIIYFVMRDKERRDHILKLVISSACIALLGDPALQKLVTIVVGYIRGSSPAVQGAILSNDGKMLDIPFVLKGETFSLLVPYNSTNADRRRSTWTAYWDNGTSRDLRHNSGLELLVTVAQLGCNRIVKSDEDL